MTKRFSLFFLLATFFVGMSFSSFAQNKGTLSIKAYNIRSNAGVVRFAVYNKKENFTHPTRFYIDGAMNIKNKVAQVISNLPAGKYAVALLHDENNSGGMDYFLKAPTEGYGFSNVKKFIFSSPSYEECLITIQPNQTTNVEIPMYYLSW
ncbi:MAG: DUF2141 domain-containing protein [Bacteroidia bacterium]